MRFLIPGFQQPFRIDVSNRSGGSLVYVGGQIPASVLASYSAPPQFQVITFEINLRGGTNLRWLRSFLGSINHHPLCFITFYILGNTVNKVILGEFNFKQTD